MATAAYDSLHPGTSLKPLLVGTGMGALKLAGGACSASASLRVGEACSAAGSTPRGTLSAG